MNEIRPFAFIPPDEPIHDWEFAKIGGDLFAKLARMLRHIDEGSLQRLPVRALRALAGAACPSLVAAWQSDQGIELLCTGRPNNHQALRDEIARVIAAWSKIGGAAPDGEISALAQKMVWRPLVAAGRAHGEHLVELAAFETSLRRMGLRRGGIEGAGLNSAFTWMEAPSDEWTDARTWCAHVLRAFSYTTPSGKPTIGIQASLRSWGAPRGRPSARSFDVVTPRGMGKFEIRQIWKEEKRLVWEPEGRTLIEHSALDEAFRELKVPMRVPLLDQEPLEENGVFLGARLAAGSGDRRVPSGVTLEDRRRLFDDVSSSLAEDGWRPVDTAPISRVRAASTFARTPWRWPGSASDTAEKQAGRRAAVCTALREHGLNELTLRVSSLDRDLSTYRDALVTLFGEPERLGTSNAGERLAYGDLVVEVSWLDAPGIRQLAEGSAIEQRKRFKEAFSDRSKTGYDLTILELPEHVEGQNDDPFAELRRASGATGFLPQVVLRTSIDEPVSESVALSAVRDLLRAFGVAPVDDISPFTSIIAVSCWRTRKHKFWVASRLRSTEDQGLRLEGALLTEDSEWMPMVDFSKMIFCLLRAPESVEDQAVLLWVTDEASADEMPLVILDGDVMPGVGSSHGASVEANLLGRLPPMGSAVRIRSSNNVPMSVLYPQKAGAKELAGVFCSSESMSAWLRRSSTKRMQTKKRGLAKRRDEARVGQVATPASVECLILKAGGFSGNEGRLHASVRRLCEAHVQEDEATVSPFPLQELVRGMRSGLPDFSDQTSRVKRLRRRLGFG